MTYPSPAYREDRADVLHAAIRELHFGMLLTHPAEGFATSYLPWDIDPARGPCGTLVGHLARYNPQSRVAEGGVPALAMFQGPHGYVSPSWYPGKREDPRQVPTWDYLIVEARGVLTPFDDEARLYQLLTWLTDHNEARHAHRWRVTDAPDDYIRAEMQHIVGIELRIDSLVGRFKLSQNRNAADREGARAGLAAAPTEREHALARSIAACLPRKPG